MPAGASREQVVVLVFEVAGNRYGVPASVVREVVRAVQPTPLPSAPAVVLGVINVRGSVAALIDLRARFGLAPAPLSASEVFVLAESGPRLLAFRADRAVGLCKVAESDIRSLLETVPHERYVEGTALLPDGVLLLCDLARFLDDAERRTLEGALRAEAEEAAPHAQAEEAAP